MINKLAYFDQFGAYLRLRLNQNSHIHKSVLGGLLTIAIYGLCFVYFIYYIYLWKSNQILPRITSNQIVLNQLQIHIQTTLATFYMRNSPRSQGIDPFDPEAIVLQPVLHAFRNNTRISSQAIPYRRKSYRYNTFQVDLSDIRFVHTNDKNDPMTNLDYILAFSACQPQYLFTDWKCANQTQVELYFNQAVNAVTISTEVQQFNSQTQQIESIGKEYFVLIDHKSTYYSQNTLKYQRVIVDTGILLQKERDSYFISDVETITQQLGQHYFSQIFNYTVYLAFAYKVGQIQTNIFIEYPKISEILADIGSICSILLFFSALALFINEYLLEQDLIHQIIQIYYPEFRYVRFQKNFVGKVQQVFFREKVQDRVLFMNYYRVLIQQAAGKMNFINLLYELSRLQFIVQSLQDKQLIKGNIHQTGIRMKTFEPMPQRKVDESNDNSKKIPQSQINSNREAQNLASKSLDEQIEPIKQIIVIPAAEEEQLLTDSDFTVLSMPSSKTFTKVETLNPLECQKQKNFNFYQVNKIDLKDQNY